jgi:hypothetical protein
MQKHAGQKAKHFSLFFNGITAISHVLGMRWELHPKGLQYCFIIFQKRDSLTRLDVPENGLHCPKNRAEFRDIPRSVDARQLYGMKNSELYFPRYILY